MDRCLFITQLIGVSFYGAVSDQVVLEKRLLPGDGWLWRTAKPTVTKPEGPVGWHLSSDDLAYVTCDMNVDINIHGRPDNWLYSKFIYVGEVQRVDITVVYTITKQCKQSPAHCKAFFEAYVMESNRNNESIPSPLTSRDLYRNISTFRVQSNTIGTGMTSATLSLEKTKNIVLAFHDQGSCVRLYSVIVSYNVCSGETLSESLVSPPRTVAPANESLLVEGKCTSDAVQVVQGSLNVICESTGKWNTSQLEGKCACKENMENKGGVCKVCPAREYNDQKGLNCTGLPTTPRNANITFVNQSTVAIRWQPPAIKGESSQLFYDVVCRKPCISVDSNCVGEACSNHVAYIPSKEGLHETQVMVTNLSSYVNYTFEIYVRNRVSEVAKRIYGVEGTFTSITVTTEGTFPGEPEVSVEQVELTVLVSWVLEHKNGVIENYKVAYIRDDDSLDRLTVTTNELRQIFEDLKVGKTYEFQVYAVNNFGKGPIGLKKFTLRNGGTTDKLLVPLSTSGGGLLIFLLIVVVIVIFVFRRKRRSVERAYMRSIEQGGELDQRRYIDPANYVDLMELLSTLTTEIERSKTKLEGLVGQGEFADVYKGTLNTQRRKDVVAVKVLRPGSSDKSQRDFLSEASIVAQFNHPNVVKLVGVVTRSRPMMILTEFLESGSLDQFLKSHEGQLTSLQLVGMARGVACGMVYLSEMSFIHRDLAARNILVGENMFCKVSDFGLSRELADDNPDSEYETQGGKIAIRWTAPEALQHRKFSSASDVWSYGIVLWEIMSFSDRPYWDWTNRDVMSRVTTGYRLPPPKDCPKVVYSLMLDCWESDKNKRPKFAEIESHLDEIIRSSELLKGFSLRFQTTSVLNDVPDLKFINEWLISIKMDNYLELFQTANIDNLDKVAKLEEKDLIEMGVKLIGHRNKMIESIKAMKGLTFNKELDEDEATI